MNPYSPNEIREWQAMAKDGWALKSEVIDGVLSLSATKTIINNGGTSIGDIETLPEEKKYKLFDIPKGYKRA